MTTKSQPPQGRNGALSSLNRAIDALKLAKEAMGATLARAALGSAEDLLTAIRDSSIDKADYVELGLTCADVCKVLNQGVDRRRADQPSQSVLQAIEKLTATVAEIQRHIIGRGKRYAIFRRFHAKDDKKAIAAWRLELDRILHVFNTELRMNTPATVSDIRQDAANSHTIISDVHRESSNAETAVPDVYRDISNTHPIASEVRSDVTNTRTTVSNVHRNKLKNREGAGGKNQATHASAPGEQPFPLPRNTYASDIRRDVIFEVQTMVSDIRRMVTSHQGADGQSRSTQNSVPGELPPPSPRVLFGRDELIERIIGLAQSLTPIALVGAGGIGKTSIILTVLHDDRIKQQFGDSRWFIRCDQFPASCTHFLRRLSKVIGAGTENPEDLTPLRRYLSSKEMLIILDNAESVLDPQGTDAQDIYAVMDELSQFSNICLCITSRITSLPPSCEVLDIPTLSIGAGRDTFYRIYRYSKQSNLVNDILEQLDFHPLSITLLATVAQHNRWNANRLTTEWETRRTGMLHVQHSSLATTIELSLASPMFRELSPDARALLGVIAFFPQGVNEKHINWLLPAISNAAEMFDKFCILSLTFRSNGFMMMLAPIRDYLRPKDPMSSPLLSTAKECYFARLSIDIHPDDPSFGEARWIMSEDVNVEHLLDVFTSIDANSEDVWDACANFMNHLCWHKQRPVLLGSKIEALPDDHPSKAECLRMLSWLFNSIGNQVERKRLLTHTLELWRSRGDDYQVALMLNFLSDANRQMELYDEGIQQAREALEIFERLGDTVNQGECLIDLGWLLHDDKQLDAAEEAASRAIDVLPEKGEQSRHCEGHRVLGHIYHSKGETEKAVHHFEVALEIASSLNITHNLFWAHFALAEVFSGGGRFEDAHVHIESAKSHATNYTYNLARASQLQAELWYKQRRFGEAKCEAVQALDLFERLGAAGDVEGIRWLIGQIERDTRGNGRSGHYDKITKSE